LIRKHEAETEQEPIRIIAVTAGALEGDKESCLAAGMDEYLTKPYTGEQLYNILKKDPDLDRTITDLGQLQRRGPHGVRPYSLKSDSSIDHSVLDSLEQLPQSESKDLVDRVIQAYIESADQLMTRLGEAIESENVDDIYSAAHTLKSSSANVGALRLSGLCEILETAVKQEDLIIIERTWKKLQAEYGKVIEALKGRFKVAAA
jgi:HPt (histidine-containing phosphotransfer) domain-containing protein